MSANHLPQLVLELLKLLFFPLKYISFKPLVIYSEAFLNKNNIKLTRDAKLGGAEEALATQ